jgi:hypothetical protein
MPRAAPEPVSGLRRQRVVERARAALATEKPTEDVVE